MISISLNGFWNGIKSITTSGLFGYVSRTSNKKIVICKTKMKKPYITIRVVK